MMSDNYEFEKSSQPQDTDDYSPYVDKQYNEFINDLNNFDQPEIHFFMLIFIYL